MSTTFRVIPGKIVSDVLSQSRGEVLRIVADTYLAHERGESVNPDSYFLRFPDKPDSRVIALPAYLGGAVDTIGLKWIASFPGNVAHDLPRASAVLLLNDYATGYPLACLEAAGISAARTAASAAVAATALAPTSPRSLAVVGAGVIARTVVDYLVAAGVAVTDTLVHDRDAASAAHLVAHAASVTGAPAQAGSLDQALARDLVVFATTAPSPYVPADVSLRAGQLLLNVSLRDLAPETLLGCNNVLDDVEHCLKAQTSPHLAEQLTGGRDFITGTLGGVLSGEIVPDPARPTVFSPFGLGVLDVAVGHHVLTVATEAGLAVEIPEFIGETTRWS